MDLDNCVFDWIVNNFKEIVNDKNGEPGKALGVKVHEFQTKQFKFK